MKNHLFVVDGDLRKIACDAWLLPVDDEFIIEETWADETMDIHAGPLVGEPRWAAGERVRLWRPASEAGRAGGRRAEIWLGRFGALDAEPEWYAAGVVDFVRRAAVRQPSPSRAVPLIGINLVGTGAGGASHIKGEVLVALFRGLQEVLQSDLSVDVVIVCWGARPYGAAQRARLKALVEGVEPSDLERAMRCWDFEHEPEAIWREARFLASQARADKLALFLGAGVSAGAGLPGWRRLLETLAGDLPDDAGKAVLQLEDLRNQPSCSSEGTTNSPTSIYIDRSPAYFPTRTTPWRMGSLRRSLPGR